VIAVITDNFWQNLKEVVSIPEFNNEKYDVQPGRWEDREMINAKLNEALGENTVAHWVEQLEAKRIPCAPVNSFSQALSDEQVNHRNMVIDLKHPSGSSTKGPGNPIKLSRTSEESFSAAPLLGENTSEVLQSLLHYSEEQIQQLKTDGVIG